MSERFNHQDPIAARIREAARRGVLSHALLFTGSGDRVAAARYAAAAMECLDPEDKPCGRCSACHKLQADIHPDFITVRDTEHKNIAVDLIRELRADAYIRPNEGRRKIYLFPDCALLTETDQNVLLKIVEEGPPYAAFLFCAENSAVVLPTLRSRCVELKLHPASVGTQTEDPETEAWAQELLRALSLGRPCGLSEVLIGRERKKPDRDSLARMLERCRVSCVAALAWLYGREAPPEEREIAKMLTKTLTKGQLMRTIEVFQKYISDCARNVGTGHVLGALAVELEGIL